MAYGKSNYGNGGGNNNGGGGNVSFAKGSINHNKSPKNEKSRHLQGKIKFPDGSERWVSAWVNGPKDNPNGNDAARHIRDIIGNEGLYITLDVGDIVQPRDGQGSNQGNGGGYGNNGGNQNGGSYGQQQGGYQQQPQQQGFQSGGFNNGGAGQGQGGFRR